jgi:hypothetical protein
MLSVGSDKNTRELEMVGIQLPEKSASKRFKRRPFVGTWLGTGALSSAEALVFLGHFTTLYMADLGKYALLRPAATLVFQDPSM